MSGPTGSVSRLIDAARGGAPRAVSALYSHVYPAFRRLAAGFMRGERPNHTLSPSALVNEVYLKMGRSQDPFPWRNRGQFLAGAARAMREILVDHARRRHAGKREWSKFLNIDAANNVLAEYSLDRSLALHEVIDELRQFHPRSVLATQMYYFESLTVGEIAHHLKIAERTVKQDLALARTWIREKLGE